MEGVPCCDCANAWPSAEDAPAVPREALECSVDCDPSGDGCDCCCDCDCCSATNTMTGSVDVLVCVFESDVTLRSCMLERTGVTVCKKCDSAPEESSSWKNVVTASCWTKMKFGTCRDGGLCER